MADNGDDTTFDSMLQEVVVIPAVSDSGDGVVAVPTTAEEVMNSPRSMFPKIVHPLEEQRLTAVEINRLQAALNTQKVTEITKAILGIESVMQDVKKVLTPGIGGRKSNTGKVRLPRIIGLNNSAVTQDKPGNDENAESSAPFVVKPRQPRSTPKEPRRPWKPERLDPTKPILQCDACGYQANRRDYMRRHQIRVHSNYRPYQCTMCDFKTTEKHDLDRHMNSKYHGGKGISIKRHRVNAVVRIKCDQCTYSSKSVKGILRHKQIHALEKHQMMHGGQDGDEDDEDDGMMPDHDDTTNDSLVHQQEDDSMPDAVTVLMMDDLMQAQQ